MIEQAGADALHVSTGSLFPHPLNPPGDFDFDTIATTYDGMLASGMYTFRNYLTFRYPTLRPIFRWIWFRMKKGRPVEGVSIDQCARHQAGGEDSGHQHRRLPDRIVTCARSSAMASFDGVSIARALIANNDLPKQWEAGRRSARSPLHPLQQVPAECTQEPARLL